MPFVIGQTVGRYRIEEEIGAGGMGVVYRGYDNKLKREIAIKVLASGMLDDPASRKRFRNEALILSRLISWSPDGKWIYMPLRPFTFGSLKTAALPVTPGSAPPSFTTGFASEADFARIPGARLIDQDNVFPSVSPGYFVTAHRSAKANLFRIYLAK